MNGSPQAYNFSTSPTTSVQNFVNLQGGINLGVTDYVGTVQLTGTGASASNFAVDAAGGGVVSTGAAGFVRFAGADSFLPGNAGPGYIAAIGKADAGTDGRFGYLVKTGSANGGSTYVLPEGKGLHDRLARCWNPGGGRAGRHADSLARASGLDGHIPSLTLRARLGSGKHLVRSAGRDRHFASRSKSHTFGPGFRSTVKPLVLSDR